MDASDGPSRREVLLTAGGALTFAMAAPTREGGSRRRRAGGTGGRTRDAEATTDREDFLWVPAGRWRHSRLREHLLAFARRRDLRLVLGQPPTNAPGVGETVRPALADASAAGVEVWVNVGAFQSATAGRFRSDDAVRERHLAGLREVAREMDRQDGDGKVVCWQEAPVMGQWSADGEWTEASVDALLTHGPAVFAAQKRALLDANPDLAVGLFVHFPYIVDSKRPDVFAALTESLRERGTTPDFGFTDFYRGWYEKDVGPDVADDAVRSLVGNARDHLGTDVYYMGQAHTIQPGHTASRQATRSNLRAARTAGAAGIGWYLATNYRPTTRGFDPFVPNAPEATFDDEPICTPTVALDRYRDAWAATVASRPGEEPGARFDIWLHGDGFDYAAHRVAARTASGDWQFLGTIGGYLDGEYPYAHGRTAVLGALDRRQFLAGNRLDLRIATDDATAPSALDVALAVPWDPATPTTERRATALIEGDRDVAAHELGRATPGRRLSPGEPVRVSIPVGEGSASLAPLVYPDHVGAIRTLAEAERESDFDPDGRFDLWVAGDGLSDPGNAPDLRDRTGTAASPAAAGLVAVSRTDVALYYGLSRERFLEDGLDFGTVAGERTQLRAAYAMPYAGSACFRTPERAGELLATQPDEAATFAIAHERRT